MIETCMMELLLYDIRNFSNISNPMLKCYYHALIFLLQLMCFNNWWKIYQLNFCEEMV